MSKWALVWLLACFAIGAQAAEKRTRQPAYQELAGVVGEVQPASITILSEDGRQVAISTGEDFTQKVAVGSRVTAWYYPSANGFSLHWLAYSLENDFLSPARILSQVHQVVLLPDPQMKGVNALYNGIERFLKARLGWKVAPRMWAEFLRMQGAKKGSTLDAVDPATGKFDVARYMTSERAFIPTLAHRARANAVLEVDVDQVEAEVRRGYATWDGMRAPISGRTRRALGNISPVQAKQKAPAATVTLKLWDSKGKILWSNRRGFALLAEREGLTGKLTSSPIQSSMVDSRAVDRWMETAFGSFLKVTGASQQDNSAAPAHESRR